MNVCQNKRQILPKLDELKYNIATMYNYLKPYLLGMCETFLNKKE